jgi:tripartite-type tricarboxylate transporter receptor subunit TctC
VVGYPAGGSTDLVARIVGQWVAERLGQPILIENKPGAGTNLAAQTVVAAPADGYTLLFAASTYAINATLYDTLPYNFQRDIVPVAGLAELPLVMDINRSLPVNTLAEFIAYAKANPGKINFACSVSAPSRILRSSCSGSPPVSRSCMPYRGGALMITDMLAGASRPGSTPCRIRCRIFAAARCARLRCCRRCAPPRCRTCRRSAKRCRASR